MIQDNRILKRIFTNANIHTLDAECPNAQAMAVLGSTVYALGSRSDIRALVRDGFQEIDLGGKTVLPGFIDTHCHAISLGMNIETWVGVEDATSVSDIKTRLEERVKQTPKGEWIKGRGWCVGHLHPEMPTRWDLDAVAPDNPVVLIDSSGHISVVNSKALELAGVGPDTDDPVIGGKIDKDPETGEPNGILRELATYKLAWMKGPIPTEKELLNAARLLCHRAASTGITSLSVIMIPLPSEDGTMSYSHLELKPFFTLHQREELITRIRLMVQAYRVIGDGNDHTFLDRMIGLGLVSGFGDDFLEIGGVKVIADGSIMARTAAMRDPYEIEPDSKGILHFPQSQLNDLVSKANQNGFQVEIHAHGDHTIDVTLNAYEYAINQTPEARELRNIITHVRILHDEQIQKIKNLDLMVNGVPGVNGWLPTRFAIESRNVGKDRARLLSRLRTLIDQGITVAGGSDCHPCHPYGPLHYIFRATNRDNFSHEDPLTIDEAIRLWTTDAAYVTRTETRKGSLACGKLADFVVLSHDPFAVIPGELDKIRVERTYVGGKAVWEV